MDFLIINLLNGLCFGSVLFLLASGLTLVLGVMGVLNLAHGALFMIGGYVGWTLAVHIGLNFWIGVLAGGLVAGLLSLSIERVFLRYLYRRTNEQALLSFGLLYMLTNLCLWIWGAEPRVPFTAPSLADSFYISGLKYPIARISLIIIGIISAVALWLFQDKTRFGAMVRAGMDNKEMAMGVGININFLSTCLFFVAGFIAGSAGVIGAQLMGLNLALGTDILLLSLAIVVVGGIGSIEGALIGSILIGVLDAFGKALFPNLALFIMYFAMIAILLIRPHGLLGTRIE